MEKIEWDFRDELISYKMNFWAYIVEVYDPLTDMKRYWVMRENHVVEKESDRLLACEKLWELVGYLDQQNEMAIDEELERRAEERWEEYEPEYWTDYEPYLDDEEE